MTVRMGCAVKREVSSIVSAHRSDESRAYLLNAREEAEFEDGNGARSRRHLPGYRRDWTKHCPSLPGYRSTRSFHVYDAIQNGFQSPMPSRSAADSMTIPEPLSSSIQFDSRQASSRRLSSILRVVKISNSGLMSKSVCFEGGVR